MKVPELCMAICCIILFFSVILSGSSPHNLTQNTRKNGTEKIESGKKKREVSGKGTACKNTIKKEKVLIGELLNTIEDFQKYLKSKKEIGDMKLPFDFDSLSNYRDDEDIEPSDMDDKDEIDDEDQEDDHENEEHIVNENTGFMILPNKEQYNQFDVMETPIPFPSNDKPQIPVLQQFNMPRPKPFEPQMGRPYRGWRQVEVPHYVDISPAVSHVHNNPEFQEFQQPPSQNLHNNLRHSRGFPQNKNPNTNFY